jgi:hypothetical protein
MSVFLLYFRTAWNDHFPPASTNNLKSQTYNSRQTSSGSNVYVSNCLFSLISSSSYGGALYCTSATYFLVESSSFISCKTSSVYGGAIYFSNNGGQSVLHEICSYDCISTYTSDNTHGQCVYIIVKDASSSKNYVSYSSMVSSVSKYSGSWFTLFLYYGKISYPSINISLNECYGDTIDSYPSIDSNSATCSFSYSSITDNFNPGYTCFYLHRTGAIYEIKCCNILRNRQGSTSSGLIRAYGNMMVEDSCILQHNTTYIFYQHSSSCTITLSNCTIDLITDNGYLTMRNTVTKSFILALNHISTQSCNSEYDSAAYLTPIIQLPSSSKKQIHLCTCGKFFHQCPQGNFFSSAFVLIFNFIHTYSSSDMW